MTPLYGDICEMPDCEQEANVYVIYREGDNICVACLCWDHRNAMDDCELMVREPIVLEGQHEA